MSEPVPSQSGPGSLHYAIKDPVRLYAQPVGLDSESWSLVAEGEDGSRLTVIASRERFADALVARGLGPILSPAEQARAMFVRGEIDVETLERMLERER